MPPTPAPAARRAPAFSVRGRARSFRYAATGVLFMVKTQQNAWIHLAATAAVALVGWMLGVSAADWRWLAVAVLLVWVAEAMNTAFEFLCDVVSPEFHASVARAKDIAAGAVLICACGAVALGALTLWPYLRLLLAARGAPTP